MGKFHAKNQRFGFQNFSGLFFLQFLLRLFLMQRVLKKTSCPFYVNAPKEFLLGGEDLFGRCNEVCLFLSFLIFSH